MNFSQFETMFKDRFWLQEFKEEFSLLDSKTFEKITNKIQEFEKKDNQNSLLGLYSFAQFLSNLINNEWTDYLNPSLVYLSTKLLVLMGQNSEAKKVSKGFEFDAGCCAWSLGSYYRNKPKTDEKSDFEKLQLQIKHLLAEPEGYSDLIFNDLLAWHLAFMNSDEIFEYYEMNKQLFKKVFPYIILLERIIGLNVKLAPNRF